MRTIESSRRVPAAPLLALGTALTLGGLVNVAMLLWPLGIGSPDWELAAFGELAVTWAVVGLGCAALIVSASRRSAAVAATVLLMVGALAVIGAVMGLLNVPLVWRTRLPPTVLTQLKVATVKAATLNLMYGVGYLSIGLMVARALIARRVKR